MTLILVTVVGAYHVVWLHFAHTLTDLPASASAVFGWILEVVGFGAFSLIPVYALFIVLTMFTAGVHLWPTGRGIGYGLARTFLANPGAHHGLDLLPGTTWRDCRCPAGSRPWPASSATRRPGARRHALRQPPRRSWTDSTTRLPDEGVPVAYYGEHQTVIMAGYPVQRGRPPVIMREAARRRARDSGTLSGTSAEEEQMTGKIMPLRERDTSTIQAAADAFLSSPRYANPNTRRGYTGVLDRLLAGLGASRPLAEVSGEELAGLLEQLWGHRNPRTAMRYVRPGAEAVAEITGLLEPPRRRG